MRKRPKDELISSRKSVWFYSDMVNDDPILNNKSFYRHSSQTNMLIDDVDSSCLPIPNFPKDKYKVRLNTTDSRCENLIIDAIETRYGKEDLTNSIYEFFNQCVQIVMTYGFAGYEIIYFSTDKGEIDSFWLALIAPSAFIIKKDKFQQYVPLEIVKERDLEGQYIDLPKENILLFELPEYIKLNYEQMMESLAFLGSEVFPRFALENIYKPSVPFSQSDYLLSKEIALAKATKEIGYNSRNYSNEYKFEHYVWQRELRFHKFLCILRETILKTLNDGLKRIGNKLNFEAELVIEGLPTSQEAENALERLIKGEIKTFSEVLDKFR
jgi:hypothetical protein